MSCIITSLPPFIPRMCVYVLCTRILLFFFSNCKRWNVDNESNCYLYWETKNIEIPKYAPTRIWATACVSGLLEMRDHTRYKGIDVMQFTRMDFYLAHHFNDVQCTDVYARAHTYARTHQFEQGNYSNMWVICWIDYLNETILVLILI